MIEPRPYRDRREAGQILAAHVREHVSGSPAAVLALPRGGVPVGFEVARVLEAPLDVFVVRKLGVPQQPELAMGAIATGGFQLLNEPLIADLGISRRAIQEVTAREDTELAARERKYRAIRAPVEVRGRVVVLVDDGLATGFTMRAAIAANRQRGATRLIVAVPVGAADTCHDLAREVDLLICPLQPAPFLAVGGWYTDFAPTSDDEVRDCLTAALASEQAADHVIGRPPADSASRA
jgi:putative phosphoribosyl transferase